MIIGLIGFKGSGKDTVASMLKKYNYTSTSFAKPLKETIGMMFDWDISLLEGITDESRKWRETPDPFWSEYFRESITPRIMLQRFGTDIVRNELLEDFWTLRLKKYIERLPSTDNIVVSDTRHLNEINMIKSLGGKLVWVKRDPLPDYYNQAKFFNYLPSMIKMITKPFFYKLSDIHSSERDWIGTCFDYVIENNGTLEELSEKVGHLITTI